MQNGVPASGKSTVTRILADHFRLPYLSLDGIDRALNRKMVCAAHEVIWSVVRQSPPELAVSRYAARLHQRREGHPGEEYLPELARLAGQAEPEHLGAVFVYDQASPPAEGELFSWIDKQAGR